MKLKPSAKTKPSLKNKDSAIVKAAVKVLLKEKKAKMKADEDLVKKTYIKCNAIGLYGC